MRLIGLIIELSAKLFLAEQYFVYFDGGDLAYLMTHLCHRPSPYRLFRTSLGVYVYIYVTLHFCHHGEKRAIFGKQKNILCICNMPGETKHKNIPSFYE